MRPRRRSRFPLFLASVVLAGGIGIANIPSVPPAHPPVQASSPLATTALSASPSPSVMSPAPTATKQGTAEVAPVTPSKKSFSAIGEPLEVELPSANFKYQIVALPAESILPDNVIKPPEDPSVVYLVERLRKKDSQVDITGHSSSDESRWPLDVISDASLVKVGDPVYLTSTTGKHSYVVSEIDSLVRGDVKASEYQDPKREDRITFFTCDTNDLYQRTRILVATRVS